MINVFQSIIQLQKLDVIESGKKYNLNPKWIHNGKYPHFDLIGERQVTILKSEGLYEHIEKFNLQNMIIKEPFQK